MQKTYEQRIAFLPKCLYEFALHDEDTRLDVLEANLDQFEVEGLVEVNYLLEQRKRQKKKKITIMLGEATLKAVKVKAAKLDIPYQTLINSILHQYAQGDMFLEKV